MSVSVSGARLGERLRRLRRERGLTLAELSRRTGLGASTLSRAEGSRITLTHDKLQRISEGLEVGVAALFAEPKPFAAVARRTVTRADATRHNVSPAADILHKRLDPTIREIHAADLAQAGGLQRLSGEAYVFVIEGEVEVLSDIYAPLRLGAGDSLYFDAAMAHAFVRGGERACRILCVRSR
ncbi:MAG TPA: cupin domain-containing protein [Caulobacteraceae bacterium]|nr:cupin domain-containing protein [Caulobacteraceae bacterium]